MVEITLGQSLGGLSKKKVQRIVPYPKCLVLLFLMEVIFFFMFVRRAVHQSKTVVRQSTTKLIVTQESWCNEVDPANLTMLKRRILRGRVSTFLIGIYVPTFSLFPRQ